MKKIPDSQMRPLLTELISADEKLYRALLLRYTASRGRFCHAVTSGMIFSLILLTSSGEMSTSYRLLICSEMSRWLIPLAYSPRIFSSIPSAFRLYLPMI